MYKGIREAAASLSSVHSFSTRMYRPANLRAMMMVEKMVIHHDTSNVGLSSPNGRKSGASEYSDMVPRRILSR